MSLRLTGAADALCGLDFECRAEVIFNDAPGAAADPGAGAGGGDEPPTDTPADDQHHTDDGDPSREAATDVASPDPDDDVDDGDDPELGDLAKHPAVRRYVNRNRNLSRRLAAQRPMVEALRALGVTDVREVWQQAEQYRRIAPLLESEEFRRFIADPQSTAQPAARREPEAELPAFDDSDFPFDKADPAGAWLHRHAHTQHQQNQVIRQAISDIAQAIKELRDGRQQDSQSRQREKQTQELGVWKTALDAAAAKVPEEVNGIPVRQLFADAVKSAYAIARAKGQKMSPQQVIDHYLKKVPKSSQAAASAAAAQRIAENNKRLPGRGAFAGGSPSPARDFANERVSDISARMVGKGYIGRR